MKKLMYLAALSVSLFLAACSSNEQEALPLAPQLEKKGVNDVNLPYRYLQSFDQVQSAKVSYVQESDGLTLLVNTGSQKVYHMYAVIEQQGSPVMVFLGNSGQKKYFIKGIKAARSFTIKIYGGFKDDSRVVSTTPYQPSTSFYNIPVKGWSASDPYIKVSSARFPKGLEQLYAELITKSGNILVFLARPIGEDFEIQKYGELGIQDIKLYGLFGNTRNLISEGY